MVDQKPYQGQDEAVEQKSKSSSLKLKKVSKTVLLVRRSSNRKKLGSPKGWSREFRSLEGTRRVQLKSHGGIRQEARIPRRESGGLRSARME